MKYKYFVRSLESVDSTNNYIKRELNSGKKLRFPLVVTAKSQTAGRGRLERSFFSPKGGLYFSVAFLGSQIKCRKDLLTVGAGVAAALAMERHVDECVTVKWVNDVLYRGKKVCGILCESVHLESAGETVYIVGIGVNTSAAVSDFMPEKVGVIPVNCTNAELMNDILEGLGGVFSSADESFLSAYNERLSIKDKYIDILVRGEKTRAKVINVEREGLKCALDCGENVYVRNYDEILTDLYEV